MYVRNEGHQLKNMPTIVLNIIVIIAEST